jgi:hypothetical protein
MKIEKVPAFVANIEIAGDISEAKRLINKRFYESGSCITIEPLTFIYTGGTEEGMRIKFINYPRFPSSSKEVTDKAVDLATLLMKELNQKTAIVLTTDENIWLNEIPPGATN